MTKRIKEDHKLFRDIISGRARKELGKLIKTGGFTKLRPDGKGTMRIPIPAIHDPRIVHGSGNGGITRGPFKKGDVIDEGQGQGKSKGQKAGDEKGEFINIGVDIEDFLTFLQEDLALPPLKPKPSQTYEEVKKKWNSLSKLGPKSLRHTRKTLLQACKRQCASGESEILHEVPGSEEKVRLIIPINDDERFRQFTEHKIPSSNAVIFFARDCSGSMSDRHCDVVSNMAWWIDAWIRKFYKKVDRKYYLHDTDAFEVDDKKFYNFRHGGGTLVSSVFEKMSESFENSYPPSKYNIFVIYFSDGDNWSADNNRLLEVIKNKYNTEYVNLFSYTEIGSSYGSGDLQALLSSKKSELDSSNVNMVLTSIENIHEEEATNAQVLEAIRKIFSAEHQYANF